MVGAAKKTRRKHHKVTTFPPEIVEALNKQLVAGRTYAELADWLEQMGHKIGTSSIQRYGSNFLSKLEKLKLIKDQAKVIIDSNPETPATEMAEAANQLAMHLITDKLMEIENLDGEKITEIFKALALLERSATSREKLKFEFDKGLKAATNKVKEMLQSEITGDPELLARLEKHVDSIKEQEVGK